MSQYVETPTKTFNAGAAIAIYLRVKLSSGNLAVAGAMDSDIGVVEAATFASGDKVAVRLRTAQGTCKMTAAGAITKGDTVYGAASGKIKNTANGNPLGFALETVTADDDIIEVERFIRQTGTQLGMADRTITTEATAGAHTITIAELLGAIYDRDCAGGARSDTTPTAAAIVAAIPDAKVGSSFLLFVRNTSDAAEELTIVGGTDVTVVGTATIGQNDSKMFLVVCTNVTSASEAVTVMSLGTTVT